MPSMKEKKLCIFSFFFFIGIFVFSGCLPHQINTAQTVLPIATFTSTSTMSPTLTATGTPLGDSVLSPKDAYDRLLSYLQSNSTCPLPCWLGIQPSESNLQIVKAQLHSFGKISNDQYLSYPADQWLVSGITIPYSINQISTEIRSSYLFPTSEDRVQVIQFGTRAFDSKKGFIFDSPDYTNLLKNYTVREILLTYGLPDQVYVKSELPSETTIPGWYGYFYLDLWYPDKGIFLEYQMKLTSIEDRYRFCPSDSFISGTLISQDSASDYANILSSLGNQYKDYFQPYPYIKSLRDAIGMSIEEFSKSIIASQVRCFESDKSLWETK
jgi:hypothetical protein